MGRLDTFLSRIKEVSLESFQALVASVAKVLVLYMRKFEPLNIWIVSDPNELGNESDHLGSHRRWHRAIEDYSYQLY
jgi:hypothetical protein